MSGSDARLHERRSARRTVLIADDEPALVTSLKRFLTLRGHAVLTAGDAAGAISLLEDDDHRIDVVLVDKHMPGGGLTVVQRLERDPHFEGRIVLISGALEIDPHVQVSPNVTWMQKPFSLAELVALVEGDVQR